jgi:hypothetical protein
MKTTIMQTRILYLIFSVMVVCNTAFSQTISKQVIGTSGNTLSNSNLKVSWTIGEPVVGLMTAGGNQLGNGYHPSLNVQALSVEESLLDVQLIVYPNPTSEMLYVSHPELNSFFIQISDLNGKLIYSNTINKEEPLDVSNYSQGMYLVTIENKESNKKNTYKIIKN